MKKNKLDNIFFKKKEIIKHTSGNLIKLFKKKKNENIFFKEAYCTWIKKNKIKGWKKHLKMKMNIFVLYGKVEFFFYDEISKKYKKKIVSAKSFGQLIVPSKIYFAFKGIDDQNLIINFSSIFHSDKEIVNKKIKKQGSKILINS